LPLIVIQRNAKQKAETQIGEIHLVLMDGTSKRNEDELRGRNEANKPVVFSKENIDALGIQKGDYVVAKIEKASQASFRATALRKTSLQEFYSSSNRRQFTPERTYAASASL
jgi:tRNA-2-methylthio-N6-dimethylallyladenosine synthase